MPGMWPPLEAVNDVGQARAAFSQIRGVDLGNISQADDLCTRAGPCHQGFHLFGCEVLCLVDNKELVQERTAAHEAHGLDLDARADLLHCGVLAPVGPSAVAWTHAICTQVQYF